jgi:hypothetical protein
MSQYPYLKKAKMPACKTVLCDICNKVHVPTSKPKKRGLTVCSNCEHIVYTYRGLKDGKQAQKKVLPKIKKSC